MITVKGLTKAFRTTAEGLVRAVRGVSFEIRHGEFYTLLGPSGCGKSTILRCIAGLERPEAGDIVIDGKTVTSASILLPPNERPISMVFQSYAIWPHMTVFGNVEFPLKHARPRLSRAVRAERVMQALAQVKMEKMAHRPAPMLSGGQQQRVALARALVGSPKVLLLDEPLSNLDAKLREELRLEIKDLVHRLGMTALYVTHDQTEALVMSDRISVMQDGQIVQEARPRELYLSPKNVFVAQFIGQVNLFEGTVREHGGGGAGLVETGLGRLACRLAPDTAAGTRVTVAIRPELLDVAPTLPAAEGLNAMQGTVAGADFIGDALFCQVLCADRVVHVKLPSTREVPVGDRVFVTVRPEHCHVFREPLP
jgi:iron(III) transport system ATP-binding protein